MNLLALLSAIMDLFCELRTVMVSLGGTTTEMNCRGGSRATVGAATPAAPPRVFLQSVPL